MSYRFFEGNVDERIQTISVSYFESQAPLASPTASQAFTETLRDVFLSQTSLDLISSEADLNFSGHISGYRVDPVAIQSNDAAALNRLTITVHVLFENIHDESRNFESDFSRFADFSSSQDFSSVEANLIEEINQQIAQDIYNRALSDW